MMRFSELEMKQRDDSMVSEDGLEDNKIDDTEWKNFTGKKEKSKEDSEDEFTSIENFDEGELHCRCIDKLLHVEGLVIY